MDVPRLPLFIYGTLRNGERNRHLLAGRIQQELPATISGRLVIIEGDDYPYPALLPGCDLVRGSLVFPQPRHYCDLLTAIDRLEDYEPASDIGLYLRRSVEVETAGGRSLAWTYLWNGPLTAGRQLSNGDFCHWSRIRNSATVS